MRRLQLFEFNERKECPTFIREAIIETLGQGLKLGRVYQNVAPIFLDFCQKLNTKHVLDLCSGSGEPVSIFLSALAQNSDELPHFTLSDLFPNASSMNSVATRHPGLINPHLTPVDATNVPDTLHFSACTIISAFHHFAPPLATRILKNCVDRGRGIFIVEPFPRNLKRASAPMPALATAAYLNPIVAEKQNLLKGIFTYGVPLIPLIGAWDATISLYRMYTKSELFQMVQPFTTFQWHYEEVPYPPYGKASVFYGIPKAS